MRCNAIQLAHQQAEGTGIFGKSTFKNGQALIAVSRKIERRFTHGVHAAERIKAGEREVVGHLPTSSPKDLLVDSRQDNDRRTRIKAIASLFDTCGFTTYFGGLLVNVDFPSSQSGIDGGGESAHAGADDGDAL